MSQTARVRITPLEFFSLTPPEDGEWRDLVREWHRAGDGVDFRRVRLALLVKQVAFDGQHRHGDNR